MKPPVGAPVDMVADHTWQWIFGSLHFGLAGIVIVAAAWGPARTRDWFELTFRMLVLFGGALGAIVFEGAIDRGGQLWYAEIDAWPLVHWYGVSVPLWVMPVYLWFLGGGSLWFILRIRAGATSRDFMKIFAAIVVADLLLEIPIIKIAKLYTYWGDTQPFYSQKWFPLPAWYLTTNRLFDLVPAITILMVMSAGKRRLVWTIPVVMPMSIYAAYALVTWPVIGALQNDLSKTVTWGAGALTMVLGMLGTYAGIKVAPRLQHAMDSYRQPQKAPSGARDPAPVGGVPAGVH
jgi:hypothetical protein